MKPLLYLILFVMSVKAESVNSNDTIRLPAEWEPHLRTFLAWPQSEEIWSTELLPGVREDVAKIANAIVEFEPVVMLADSSQVSMAQSQLDKRIEVVGMPIDDLWVRDTLPAFVLKKCNVSEHLVGVDFNYDGYGRKKIYNRDAEIARRIVDMFKIESRRSLLVAEGGSFETDGAGTLLATKSSIVNKNRNNNSIDEIEMELKAALGVKKIIWFNGVRDQDITDGHVDCLVRFVRPGVVIINRPFPGSPADVWSISSDEAASILKNSTDANGNPFEVVDLVEPDPDKIAFEGDREMFVASYVNFYIGNGFVIVPAFGDEEADAKARTTLQEQFRDRKVVSVLIGTLAAGGGGIHCSTHEQPEVKSNLCCDHSKRIF